MSATILYRIVAVVFVFFAAGHTFGSLSFKPPTAEALAAQKAMYDVSFTVGGSSFTFGGFYTGMSLSITASMLFYAVLAWQLAGLAATQPKAITGMAWAFFAFQLPGLVLAAKYFGIAPLAFSAVVAAVLGWAAWQVSRA